MDAYTRRPRRPFYLDRAARDHALAEVKRESKSERDIDPTMLERVIRAVERHKLLGKEHEVALQAAVEDEKVHPTWIGLYKMGVGYYYGRHSRDSARARRRRGTVPQVPDAEIVTLIDPDGQGRLL